MAGIPLPALDVRTPTMPETVDAFSRLIGLRNQTQAQTQALTEDKQRFQETEADQQKFQAAVRDGGGDPVATGKLLLKYGVQPKTLQTYTNYVNELNQGAQRMQANQLAISAKLNDMASGGMQGVMKAPQAQRQAAYDSWKANPVTQQWAKASGADLPALAPDDNWFQMHISQNTLGSDIAAANIKKQQLAIQQQNANASTTEANRPTAATLAVQAQETGPDGKPSLNAIKAQHALTILQGPQKPPAAPATKTMMVDGQPHIMAWNPQTGRFDQDMGLAQPNYGQQVLPTRTVKREGPDGLEHIYAYNTATQRYDVDQGVSTSGAYGHEMLQANAVLRAGNGLIDVLQANKSKLGTLGAWVKKYGLNTPIADPDLAKLQSQLSTFSALQPAMHGFRSHSALETFDKIIGGVQQDPRATIGAIQGILDTARSINPSFGQQGSTNKQTTAGPKAGDTRQYQGHTYKFDGKEWVRQ